MSLRRALHGRRIESHPSVDGLEDRIVLNGSMSTYIPTNPAIASDVATIHNAVKGISVGLSIISGELSRYTGQGSYGALSELSNLKFNATTAVAALQNDQSLLNSYYTQTLASLEQQRQGLISRLQTNLETANSNLNAAWASLTPEEQNAQVNSFAAAYNLAAANTIVGINATQAYYAAQEQALANNYIQVNQQIASALASAQDAVGEATSLSNYVESLIAERNRLMFGPTQ